MEKAEHNFDSLTAELDLTLIDITFSENGSSWNSNVKDILQWSSSRFEKQVVDPLKLTPTWAPGVLQRTRSQHSDIFQVVPKMSQMIRNSTDPPDLGELPTGQWMSTLIPNKTAAYSFILHSCAQTALWIDQSLLITPASSPAGDAGASRVLDVHHNGHPDAAQLTSISCSSNNGLGDATACKNLCLAQAACTLAFYGNYDGGRYIFFLIDAIYPR